MKSQDTLTITSQVPAFNNKHTMQAFCDVFNDQDGLCRCNLLIKTGETFVKIGHIYQVTSRDDLGPNAYMFQIRLNNNFVNNFNVKSGGIPELEFKDTDTGLITHVVLLNWSNHFVARANRNA